MSLISAGSISLDSTFKGLSQNGGRTDFSKNLRASLVNNDYRMSLIFWAGFISLDSTFKRDP